MAKWHIEDVDPVTAGEFLADVARAVMPSRPRLMIADVCPDQWSTDLALASVKLALALRARPVLQLRAIIEGWDVRRIVRELY